MILLTGLFQDFTLTTYIDFAISIVLLVLAAVLLHKFVKNTVISIVVIVMFILRILASLFGLNHVADIVNIGLFSLAAAFCVIYAQEIQRQLNARIKLSKLHDITSSQQENLIKELVTAINLLSAEKTGAIITIERKDKLDHYIQSGDAVDAPVTAQMLCTIFYKGTPLHDGALIIRGVTIEAASVFFIPSTKALSGNYGARHRAALGISEVCDAVTIVVSEQTGRVSIAYSGEIISVNRDNIAEILAEYLRD